MPPTTPPFPKRPPVGPKPAGDSTPAALRAKARALMDLDHRLRQTLPEPLRRNCCLADVRSNRLVFLANSPAWAVKLRLHQTQLLAEASKHLGTRVGAFAVKVADLASVPPETPRRKPLSSTAAEHLKAAAKSISDPELRAVFLQLASLADTTDSIDGPDRDP